VQFGGRLGFQQREFWIANAAFLTAVVAYCLLAWCLAAAQLAFASENRSTGVRRVMLLHQALFAGWMAYVFAEYPEEEFVLIYMALLALHWYVLGAFMTGEWPQLSTRVKRSLPQTLLGRVFLTWFNPGPGAGYVFAVVNLAAGLAVGWGALYGWSRFVPGRSWRIGPESIAYFGLVALCYVVIFLGVGRLIVTGLRRFFPVNMLLTVLLHVVLSQAAWIVPFVFLAMSDYRGEYSLLHITNWPWTLKEVADEGLTDLELMSLLISLPLAALLVLVGNLPGIVGEVRHERLARPRRVDEEDAQIEAELHPPQPVQISPWDVQSSALD